MIDPHPIPASLEVWLDGWQTAKSGNAWKKIGADMYVVYRKSTGVWAANVGRTPTRKTWKSEDRAKAGLWRSLRNMPPADIAAAHAGTLRKTS